MQLKLLNDDGHWDTLKNYPNSTVKGQTATHSIFTKPKKARKQTYMARTAKGVWGRK